MTMPTSQHAFARTLASPATWIFTAASALSFGFALPASAGAWVQEEGSTLTILKLSHTDDTDVFDDGGKRTDFNDGGRSRQDQINLYVEHGLTPDLTLVGNFYFKEVRYRSDDLPDDFDDTTRGFGDQEFGVRYRLNPGFGEEWVGAVQALVSVPTYSRDADVALGEGGYHFELRYSVGRGFMLGERSGYIDAGIAGRKRTGNPADEIRADLTTGLALTRNLMLIGELNHIEGLGNESGNTAPRPMEGVEPGSDTAENLVYINSTDYDLTKLSLSGLYTLPNDMQLQAGYMQPVDGRNTGAAGGPFVAAWWRF
ncbi:hypothetical protein KEM63_11395 [Halopseudomonas nanhaiensis]|uniref:hypothetical protein n=1 Tax=Halopseudomonas nanhaiensis TaxID=2830842 RepID=UPI001CBE4580|nr:hypothetical protein [Halopseudomonas nanhaiensis]UAW97418.1 hypothetical protein KEM63_11395 [Halopseudomonas nanhaiensis]